MTESAHAWAAFAAQAGRSPDRNAVVGEDWRLTYAELRDRALAVAAALKRSGVRAGDAVLVSLDRHRDLVPGMLGVWARGAAFVPVLPSTPALRLRHITSDCGATAEVCDAGADERLAGELRIRGVATGSVRVAADPSLAYVIYTSGSTGRPKGVEVRHSSVLHMRHSFAAAIDEPCRNGAGPCRVAATSSMAFDVFVQHLTHLFDGDELYLPTDQLRTDEASFVRWVRRHRITVVSATPSQVPPLLTAGLLDGDRRPQRLLVGAEAMSAALWQELSRAPVRTFNIYGATETTVNAAVAEIEPDAAEPHIGQPLAGCALVLVAADGTVVSGPGAGELCVRGPLLAKGYRGLPELTATRFAPLPAVSGTDRLYRTGDQARRGRNGLLSVVGRIDRQVKLHGHRIEPAEIENALVAHPVVAQACVVPVFAGDVRHCLVALVVPADGATALDEPTARELRDHCRARLPAAMVPRHVLPLSAVPLTDRGKVDETALIRQATARLQQGTADVPDDSPAAMTRAVWRDVLGEVTDDSTVVGLGGSSLDALRIAARLAGADGAAVTAGELLSGRTLRESIAAVEATGWPGEVSGRRHREDDDHPVPDAQRRLWIEEQTRTGDSAYHLALAYRIRGPLDRDSLGRAVDRVVATHGALRTVFGIRGRAPVQRILPAKPGNLAVVEGMADDLLAQRIAQEFHLDRGPLARFELFPVGPEEHLFLLCVHHVVADGGSLGVLTRDISAAYADATGNRPRSGADFVDYVHWQREVMTAGREESLLAHWSERLRGVPHYLELPGWVDSVPGVDVHTVELDRAAVDRLRTLALGHGVTPHTVLLTLFQDVVHRWTGCDDLVIGVPFMNRGRPEFEETVGFFINILPIRSCRRVQPPPLAARIGDTARALVDAVEHADVPYDRLIKRLAPQRWPGRTPLVQIVLRMERDDFDQLVLPGLAVSRIPLRPQALPFEVEAVVDEGADGPRACRLFYRRSIPAEDIAVLAGWFAEAVAESALQT